MQLEHGLLVTIPGMIAAAAMTYAYTEPLIRTLLEQLRAEKDEHHD